MKIIIISSICLILIILLLLLRKFKIKIFSLYGLEKWAKKYDKLLGLLISVVLVIITGYYAYLTHNMLDQSDKQFRLSQCPIIGIQYVDRYCYSFSGTELRTCYPFIVFPAMFYRFEVANLSSSGAINVKININFVSIFKNGKKTVIRCRTKKGFEANDTEYHDYTQIPYFKANQVDTVDVFNTGNEFLKLIGFEQQQRAVLINRNFLYGYFSNISKNYFEVQCVYSNTLNQMFKTTNLIEVSCTYQLDCLNAEKLSQILAIDTKSEIFESKPINLKEYLSLESEITGKKDSK